MHPRLLLPVGLCLSGACGGGDPCGGAASLAILDPDDGQMLTAADDVTPGGTIDYDFVVRACGFEETDQIVLRLLVPFETDYGFMFADDTTLVYPAVPLLPGDLQFRVASMDGSVTSEIISVSVAGM